VTYTDVNPHAPEFTSRLPVAPGHVALRDRLDTRMPQEAQLGEEMVAEDFANAKAYMYAADSIQTVDQTNGRTVYSNKVEVESLGENAGRAPYREIQTTSDTDKKSGTKPRSDMQPLTELFWNQDNEENVGEAMTLSDAAWQSRTVKKTDTQATSVAATGAHGYGRFGYGQGGYGGRVTLAG